MVLLATTGRAFADEADTADVTTAEEAAGAGGDAAAPSVPLRDVDRQALDDVPSSGAELLRRGEIGVASYYAHEFAGRRTASGLVFDPGAMTAAHRYLPLGSEVRVTNLDNGRTATALITDRGPYAQGRILDASLALARKLGFVRAGTARVKVEVLSWRPIDPDRDTVVAAGNDPD